MLFSNVFGALEELEATKFEAFSFKAADDVTNKTTLDTYTSSIRLILLVYLDLDTSINDVNHYRNQRLTIRLDHDVANFTADGDGTNRSTSGDKSGFAGSQHICIANLTCAGKVASSRVEYWSSNFGV